MELPVKLTEQTVQFGCARVCNWQMVRGKKQFPAFEALPVDKEILLLQLTFNFIAYFEAYDMITFKLN